MHTFRADINAANDNRIQRKWRWALGILGTILIVTAIAFYETKSYLFEGLPDLPDKTSMWEMNLQPNTTLLDMDGNIIGHRGPHIGRPLKLAEMPSYLPNAFLAIEDERFYEHTGVDRKAVARAFFANTKSGTTRQGGSTLTQQLVKNMLLTPDKNYRRKFQEMWLAYEMEQVLSKPEILELYLNRIDLGNRSFGVEAAARRYFGKSAKDVTLAESAMLASLPKAPSRYDPTRNYDGAVERSKLVLQRMVANNMISLTEMSQAENALPIIAEDTDSIIEPALIGYAFDMLAERGQELVGHKSKDLIITTTLNTKLQAEGHKALNAVIKKNEKSRKVSEGSLVMADNATGAVRVLIGGRDYKSSKYNRAAQAKRQPGSSFKAFVYASALEHGFTPGTVRVDQLTTIGKWRPANYTKRYRGPLTVREALKLSINTVAAQIGNEVGPHNVADLAKRFGIRTDMRAHPSIALGASEVTLYDMVGAYMVFANEGVKRDPYMIETISDTAGNILYTRSQTTPERVYPARYARQMVSMLRDVVATGTGHGAKIGERELGGKTGTSQDFRDAWFLGFSRQYTTGVWMGNDDNSSMVKVTGGLLPVDAWKKFMIKAHRGLPKRPLTQADPEADTEEGKALQAFYAGLIDELVLERNLASGIAAPEPQAEADSETRNIAAAQGSTAG